MREFLRGVLALLRKELLMIFKDARARIILVAPIIVQTIIFGHVATFDLNLVEYALLDDDHSHASRLLARQFDGAPIFRRTRTLASAAEIAPTLDNKRALLVLHIGAGFERQLNLGQSAPVQVLIDGRNSNVAAAASGYANALVEAFNSARTRERGGSSAGAANTIEVHARAWFNPNMETRWGILSALVTMLGAIQVMVLAGQSVAREREQGTFDQLLVTPLGPTAIMLGKALPPVLVGLLQSSIVLAVARGVFHIPFAGALPLLYAALLLFNLALVGVGLCVSALTSTMQQAMLYSFTLLMPMILLSGFVTPLRSMPPALQWATLLNPARYGVDFSRRIYLEGAGLADIAHDLWPLALIAIVTLGAASRLFRSRL